MRKLFKGGVPNEERAKIKRAYKDEMSIVKSNGYEFAFLFASDLHNLLESKDIHYYFSCHLDYSYIASLLGITKINPLSWNLHKEILYGDRFNKAPYLMVHVPLSSLDNISDLVVSHLKYGNEKVKRYRSKARDDSNQELSLIEKAKKVEYQIDESTEALIVTDQEEEIILRIYGSMLLDKMQDKIQEEEEKYSYRLMEAFIYQFQFPMDMICYIDCIKKLKNNLLDIIDNDNKNEKKRIRNYLLERIPLKTLHDLFRIIAVSRTFNSYKILRNIKWITNDRFDFTRDQVVDYLLEKQIGKRLAFQIMDRVRKGRGIPQDLMKVLKEHGVDSEFIEYCNSMPFLPSKAAVLTIMNILIYNSLERSIFEVKQTH
ncbi:MAG: hypothetical protein IJH64_05115 [Oscillospiraceae bacterium]|nr:hypothetical protein [Oscillospiraceae bacterium]